MSYKILCTIGSKFTKEAKDVLGQIGQVDCLDLDQMELNKIIKDYDIIFVGLGLNVEKQVIDNGKKLKIIATATTGLDHIDVAYAEEKNIKILSLKGESEFLNTITGTAELAFGLMIDLLRLTHSAFLSVKNYEWDRERFRGHNLYGQTLGIVGLGRLGGWMAKYGQAAGMRLIAHDPNVKENIFKKFNCEPVDFNELLAQSDIISIHVHLIEETENIFNKDALVQMKNTAYLINTARGKIVNEADLLKALKNKEIAGYATDVLADELQFGQGVKKHPLIEYAREHDNCLIVPHIGGMTYESRAATDIFMAKKIVDYIKERN